MDESQSLRLIEALSRIWTRIRLRHPDVPPVVLLPAPAPRGEMNVLGHFAALRWKGRKEGDPHLHEVVVVAEHLNRDASDIVETLLHEAAHAMNFVRGVKDCSASQYHNQKFKEAAEELGLEVTQVRHYGFALTAIPEATLAHFEYEVRSLELVLIHRKHPTATRAPTGTGPPPPSGGGAEDDDAEKPRSRLRKAVCNCGFIIRVTRKTIDATVIRCDRCGQPFRLA